MLDNDDEWPTLQTLGRRYVERVLNHTGGNKTHAAEVLGVDRRTIGRILREDWRQGPRLVSPRPVPERKMDLPRVPPWDKLQVWCYREVPRLLGGKERLAILHLWKNGAQIHGFSVTYRARTVRSPAVVDWCEFPEGEARRAAAPRLIS